MEIYLYQPVAEPRLDIAEIASYLERRLPTAKVEVRLPFVRFFLDDWPASERTAKLTELARGRAAVRVSRIDVPWQPKEPLTAEVDYELRSLEKGQRTPSAGLLYEGFEMLGVLRNIIPLAEAGRPNIHVIFSDLLPVTWDDASGRYHARVAIYGNPTLISMAGLVEAPAKPRDFYLDRQVASVIGSSITRELKEKYKDRALDFEDERTTEVLKGYVMQSVFYQMTGDPFCTDPECRLYNAHWQEEVLRAQLNVPYEFCPQHEEVLLEIPEREGFGEDSHEELPG